MQVRMINGNRYFVAGRQFEVGGTYNVDEGLADHLLRQRLMDGRGNSLPFFTPEAPAPAPAAAGKVEKPAAPAGGDAGVVTLGGVGVARK